MKSFFPNYLKQTRSYINNKQQKYNQKWNHDPHSHIENIQERSEKSTKGKCSTISHKYFGRINIKKHESNQDSNQNSYHRSSDIRLIAKSDNTKNK